MCFFTDMLRGDNALLSIFGDLDFELLFILGLFIFSFLLNFISW